VLYNSRGRRRARAVLAILQEWQSPRLLLRCNIAAASKPPESASEHPTP
jgi:hypothetical protein